MSQEDLEINRNVRRVLIRHWIDLGRLSFRSIRGKLTIRGSLQRIAGIAEDLTTSIVNTMFNEISGLRGIVHMHVELDNWAMIAGQWQPSDRFRRKRPLVVSSGQGGLDVQDIPDDDGTPQNLPT